ncbi:MAG: sigma-70 family RNA polymerase sigma factor [Ruminococcus sp.]|nr:sigma-70 family RNA polymerase sigma factor [Ruminococcus sp.]
MKESKLIHQLKKKNITALERCIEMYTPYVSTIIRNTLRGYVSHEDLEELTADVFHSLWEHAEQIRSEYLSGYLASIAKSKACNYMRKNIVITETLEDVVIASDENVEEEADQQELARLLKALLEELPDKEREIMIRYYYYQQTVSEVAQEMDMNLSTIKTKLSRSRKRLKQMLIERGYGYEEMELI